MATVQQASATGTGVIAAATAPVHYVDWGAILAGAFVAAAVSSVFLAFGSAIGLSLTAVTSASPGSMIGLSVAAALWLLWVQVSSFVGGGYVAGRMRRRIGDAKPHEVEMRDGGHGLLVWAVGVVVAAVLAGWIATSVVPGAAGSIDYHVDRLLRSDSAPSAAAGSGDNEQIGRILAMSVAARAVDATDRAYAVRKITAQAGVPEPEAQQRFDATVASLRSQADMARRYGIVIAFLTAASLLVSAAAAWWAACAGGKHRDDGVDHSRFTAWR